MNEFSAQLPVIQGHLKVKVWEGHLDNFVQVADEGVEDAVQIRRVRSREVGGTEVTMGTSVAFKNETLARCQMLKQK